MPTARPQRFHATLETGDRALGWTIARVPFDPAAIWPERIRQRVRGSVNGFALRSSLFPFPGEVAGYYLLINRATQAGAGVRLGDTATFTLEPDLEPRPAELPEQLDLLLDEAEGLRDFYNSFTEYARREMGKWITQPKSTASRLKRGQEMAERLLATMEAEAALPPAIEQAFRTRPRARTGWPLLTAAQRRSELMAVFGYKSPESVAKRIGRLCDVAESKVG